MSRFDKEILATRRGLKAMIDAPGKGIDHVHQLRALDKPILDLNSSASETYGRRERFLMWRLAE